MGVGYEEDCRLVIFTMSEVRIHVGYGLCQKHMPVLLLELVVDRVPQRMLWYPGHATLALWSRSRALHLLGRPATSRVRVLPEVSLAGVFGQWSSLASDFSLRLTLCPAAFSPTPIPDFSYYRHCCWICNALCGKANDECPQPFLFPLFPGLLSLPSA